MELHVHNLAIPLPNRASDHVGPVTFTWSDTQTLAVVGAAHTGKSALLLCIGGWMRTPPGSVELKDAGIVVTERPRRSIGLGPIAHYSPLFETLMVREHVYFQLKLLRQPSARRRTEELIRQFDLAEVQQHRVKDLDSYAHFRTCVAVAMAGQPRFVLLDDPLDGLTEAQCAEAGRFLRTLNRNGTGVLFTTSLHTVLADVDGVISLPEGEVTYVEHSDHLSSRVGPAVPQ